MESFIAPNSVSSRQLLLISRPCRHSLPRHLSTRRNLLIHAARSSPLVSLHLPMTCLSSSSIDNLQPHKPLTNIGVSLLKRARKTLTVAIIVAVFSFLAFPPSDFHPAIAAPTIVEMTDKSETLADHEFSCYTRRLLSVASVLLKKIEDAELGRGDMAGVNDALKEVKASSKKILDEVIGNLNAELKELRRVNMELTKRSKEVLGTAKVAMKERGRLLGSYGKGQDKTVRLEDLDRAIGDAEKEYNDLLKEIGETENKIVRRETMTYSIAVRELYFIEEECDLLVQRFGHRMMEDAQASEQMPSIKVSGKDIQNGLEKAQKEYWKQMVLPKVLGTDDREMLLDSSINDFSQKIERVLGESQQIQSNLEDQIRQKFKQFGDEKRFIVKTPETEVLKGFPEAELKWMFGTKEVVVPNAVRLHLFHGWKKWREDTKVKLKKQLLEDIDQGKQYVAQRRERIILDRERLIAKTWYNDERKRWEMDPVAVPYAVSKKLIEYARIRHDWAVMYLKLKGDDKEYFVDIMVFELLFEKSGGFDSLYTSMIASGIPTTVHLMWIPFSDLDIGEQFLLILRLPALFFIGIWNSAGISYVKKAVFSIIKDITDDLMVTTFFPIIEFIIPESVRRKIGMAWPEEASQTVESTWFLKWQSDAELNYRARKRDNISWYLWFFIRSSLYVYVLFGAILFFKRTVLCFLGLGPLRRHDPNLRKMETLNYYFRYKKKLIDKMREDGVDPIRSAFDQMKRIKDPPIRLDNFASIESMRDEINDIVTCLQNPTAFREKGARAPRGILIVGESGTGKTSLALAIAAEARVPVVEVKAQQLEAGLWVGQSASNVRELFQAARDLAPVIIFIEDFDLFAGIRGKYIHTEKQDHEAFINQLLVELDGFENQDGVVLIATTRNLNQIDEALQRPGRMDRVLHLQRPTQMEREKILLFAAKETMDNDLMNFVDWKKVAEKTALLKPRDLKLVPLALEVSAFRYKFSDAEELKDYSRLLVILRKVFPAWIWETNLLKKICMNLSDHLGLTLTKEDIQSVVDLMEPYGQISSGLELLSPPINWTTKEKFPHAVWTAGRGLIALLLPNYDIVEHIWLEPASWEGIGCTKITKVRRESSLNGNLESRSYLEKQLVFCFGSFVAAQLLLPFGEENLLSSLEIKKAQEIATSMVLMYGWGPDDSPAIYATDNASGAFSMGNKHALEMAAKIEKLFKLAYEKACAMLQKNCRVLEAIVEQLLEYENLKGEDLIRVFEENGGIREEEPFTIIKYEKTEVGSERSLKGIGDSAAAVAFLDSS